MILKLTITQAMIDAVGDIVERAERHTSIRGLIFLQVAGGKWAIYSPHYNQALRKRWDNAEAARTYAKAKLCDKVS